MKKSQRTKSHILEKSAPLFNQRGFTGTAMADIESETRLTKRCIYGHFKNKSELAIETFQYSVQKIEHMISERTRHVTNPVDKLKIVVYFYREHVNNSPIDGGCPLLNSAIEADDHVTEMKAIVHKALLRWHSGIVKVLQRGMENGEVVQTCIPEYFAWKFIGTLEGANFISRITSSDSEYKLITEDLLKDIEALRLK